MQSIKGLLPLAVLTALAVFAAFVLSKTAKADELHVLELDQFSMDYGHVKDYRDGYFQYAQPGDVNHEHWKEVVAVNFDLSLLRYEDWGVYWNNSVTTMTTDHQYRYVSWRFEGGLNLGSKVRVWGRHLSAHVLDDDRDQHFPLENTIGATFVMYRREP